MSTQPLSSMALITILCFLNFFVQLPSATAVPIYIDVGSEVASVDPVTQIRWDADAGFTQNGTTTSIPETNLGRTGNLSLVDRTLRYWNFSSDSCYDVPVSSDAWVYLIRLSFCYNNYDGQYMALRNSKNLPTIGVAIEEFLVESVTGFGSNTSAYYTDYVVPVQDGSASICFFSVATTSGYPVLSPPFVNSIQVLPLNEDIYDIKFETPAMSNYFRINAGGLEVIPTASSPQGYKTWAADFQPSGNDAWNPISSPSTITLNSDFTAYEVPDSVLKTARQASGNSTGYRFVDIHPVDPDNYFMVVLYFAEVDSSVKEGDRVFNVVVNGKQKEGVDIRALGGSHVLLMSTLLDDLSESDAFGYQGTLNVLLYHNGSSQLPPIINGIEVYEVIPPFSTPTYTSDLKLRINCGSDAQFQDQFGNDWYNDTFYSSGSKSHVPAAETSLPFAQSLRYFDPTLSASENCYSVPAFDGFFLVRAYFDYGNWDLADSNQSPTFSFGVNGVVIDSVTPTAPGFFRSVFTNDVNSVLHFCLYLQDSERATFINSLEVLKVDNTLYSTVIHSEVILYSLFSINSGGPTFGDLISETSDPGFRQWFQDANATAPNCGARDCPILQLNESQLVAAEDSLYPSLLYLTARVATENYLTYSLAGIPGGSSVLLYLHFAELDPAVKEGDRVFNVSANGALLTFRGNSGTDLVNIDIVKEAQGSFTPAFLSTVFDIPNSDSNSPATLLLKFEGDTAFKPLISGIELFRLFNVSTPMDSAQELAMIGLQDTLQVPAYVGWQGRPCSPQPWKGVTCSEIDQGFSITEINLPNEGLSGFISEKISGLTQLVTLNLSNNKLVDTIPFDLSYLTAAVTIDLSHNLLSGEIPDGLGSLPNLTTLNLQDNQLEGQVPQDLNPPSASLRVNYSGNEDLCGVSGLAACPSGINYTAPPLEPPTVSGPSSGSSVGAIIGGLVGAIVVVGVVGAAIVFVMHNKRRSSSELDILERDRPPPVTSRRRNPYWRSKTGEFEMMNSGHDV